MAGTTSPGAEGPTFAPPQLPPGWIAQWDGTSRKYYYVQLSTGVSQWEVPTEGVPTGATPAPQRGDHPYGVPGRQELITHPDGTQTVRHPDGTLEPINPPMPPDGTRGIDGPTGDRGLGSMAMNALMGGKNSGNSVGTGSSPLGNLAGQFLGGGNNGQQGGGGGGSGAGSSVNSGLGKIGGALASSFLSSNGDKPDQPQNYHGGAPSGHHQNHGLAGSIMGGVANMMGGNNKPSHSDNGFGYSNTGAGGGGYSGPAPPTSYQPAGHSPSTGNNPIYQQSQQSNQQSFPPAPGGGSHNPSSQSHAAYGQGPPPPVGGSTTPSYGQTPGYGATSHSGAQYGGSHSQQPYGGGPSATYPGSQAAYTNANGPPHRVRGAYGPNY